MKAINILRAVRQKEQDNDEVKYSDYDITCAMNEVLRYVNVDLSNKGSDYLHKMARYNQDEINAAIVADNEANVDTPEYEPKELVDFAVTGVKVPDSFISIMYIQRTDGYRLHPVSTLLELQSGYGEDKYLMAGGRIYVKHKEFILGYMGGAAPVKNIEKDEVQLPDIFFDTLVKLIRIVLNNNDVDTMTQAVTGAVDEVIPRRRYSNSRQKMPFYL